MGDRKPINEFIVTNNKFKTNFAWLKVLSGLMRPAGLHFDHTDLQYFNNYSAESQTYFLVFELRKLHI